MPFEKIRPWVPSGIISIALYLLKPITGFSKKYNSWEEALASSKSYEDPNIVSMYEESLKKALRKRNLQNFDISQREARLAMAILRVVAEVGFGKEISVLDVGGATGGHLYLFSKLGVRLRSYDILESPSVVDVLKVHSNDEMVWVYEPSLQKYDLVLCSGTLQYLRKAEGLLADWARISDWIIIDRTPITEEARSVVRRQNVLLPGLRRTSYPSWFFSRAELVEATRDFGHVILEWEVPEDSPLLGMRRQSYSGFLLDCRQTESPNEF